MFSYYNTNKINDKLNRSVESLNIPEESEKKDLFNQEPSAIEESLGAIMKSFIKLMSWSKEFFNETNSKVSMYMSFFQANYDENIAKAASNAIIYIDKIIDNPNDSEMTTMKYCLDKFLGDMKGKAVFSEDYINSVLDLTKFIKKILILFKNTNKNGTLIKQIDEILCTSEEMSKSRYDELHDFYEGNGDGEEDDSLISKLKTIKNLSTVLKSKLNKSEIADDVNTDSISFQEYEKFSDIRDSFENIKNNNCGRLTATVHEVLTEVLSFVLSLHEMKECVDKIRTVDPNGLKDHQIKLFNSYTTAITEYCLAISEYVSFIFELYDYLTAHFSIIKTSLKREEKMLGI